MEIKSIKKNYSELNEIARSPTLQTVFMVEKFIENNSGEFKKKQTYLIIFQKKLCGRLFR